MIPRVYWLVDPEHIEKRMKYLTKSGQSRQPGRGEINDLEEREREREKERKRKGRKAAAHGLL